MISKIKTFFQDKVLSSDCEGMANTSHKSIHKASAALMVEVMLSDGQLNSKEEEGIKALLTRAFDLTQEECDELFCLAQDEVNNSISLYEFTGQVNLHFSANDKFELIKHMWHIAFIDNELDKYEESVIRQVADLIYLPHSQFIKAKSVAKNDVEKNL